MDFEAVSITKQLRAGSLDITDINPRDELHVWGALESWLSQEGLRPWDPDVLLYQTDGSAHFNYSSGLWIAKVSPSLNFPNLLKLSLTLDVMTIPHQYESRALEKTNGLANPHFGLTISHLEEELVLSATAVVGGEPKNYQIAIGVAINDILSLTDSLLETFADLPDTQSLMNY